MRHEMKVSLHVYFLFTCFLCFCDSAAVSFVFVHLGKELPPYLIETLVQVRLFNKTKKIYLLANIQALKKRSPMYDELGLEFVPIESIRKSVEHKNFLNLMWKKKNTRTGFWVFTSERFFVLYDWMKQHNKKQILHLENDTLLYADIDEFMPIFKQRYPGLAVVMDDDARCVPCFMYIAKSASLEKLISFFNAELTLKPVTEIWHLNDMLVIGDFFKTHGPRDINNLPIIMPSYVKKYGLKNLRGSVPQNPRMYYKNIHLFKSIFDGASLGQYLGGTIHNDPPGFISETNVFDASRLDFKWQIDSEGRKIPYVRSGGVYFRINTLHIHSKQMGPFLSNNGALGLVSYLMPMESYCGKNETLNSPLARY